MTGEEMLRKRAEAHVLDDIRRSRERRADRLARRGRTEQVTGLTFHRSTEPWQGNGFVTRTYHIAMLDRIELGAWCGDSLAHSWIERPGGERVRFPGKLAEWRKAVVAEARRRLALDEVR